MKNLLSLLFCLCFFNLYADIKISGTLSDVTTGPSPSQGTITITCKGRGECGTIKKISSNSGQAQFQSTDKQINFYFESFETRIDDETTSLIFYLPE
jgi:hypothetical protein